MGAPANCARPRRQGGGSAGHSDPRGEVASSDTPRRLLAVLLLLLLLPAAPLRLEANPFDSFGLGSRSAAMGGAVTAMADDFSAALYNPAGLVDAGQMEVSVGYFTAHPSLETHWFNAWRDVDEDTVSGLVLGLVFPAMKALGMEFVGGLGLHLPDKRVARSLMLPYDQPRFVMFGARNQRTVVLSPNALRITPWLAIGAGFQMFIDTSGGPQFELVEHTTENEGKFSEGTISSTQKPRFFPFAGLLLGPWKGLRFGFAFRDRQEITLDIPMVVRIEALTLGLLDVPLLPASSIDLSTPAPLFFSPRQYAFGLSWRPWERLLLAMDVTYMEWSAFINPGPDGYTIYSGGLAILLRQNPNFHLPQGHFHDIWVPAFGLEWLALNSRHVELFVRAGYRFRPSPVPEQKGRAAFLDSDTHVVSGGFGLTFKDVIHRIMTEPFSLDFHVQYFHLQERQYERALIVALSDRFGDIRFRGNALSVGVTATVRF